MKTSVKINFVFHAFCALSTVGFVAKCIYTYCRDEDVAQIQYQKFHETDQNIYPSTTICFKNPLHAHILIDRLNISKPGVIKEAYKKFLSGKLFDSSDSSQSSETDLEMLYQLDYDEMTTKLEEHLLFVNVLLGNNEGRLSYTFENGTFRILRAYHLSWSRVTGLDKQEQFPFSEEEKATVPVNDPYISHRSFKEKCYTFDLPYIKNEKIRKFGIVLDARIFKEKNIWPRKNQYSVSFHAPHQKRKSLSTRTGWESKYDDKVETYERMYYLENIEVLKRRDKRSSRCIKDRYDETIVQNAINLVGCKLSIPKTDNKMKYCKTRKEYERFQRYLTSNDHSPPCKELQSISKWHGEKALKKERQYIS